MESLKVRNSENQVPLLSPEKEDLTEEIDAKKVLLAQLKRLETASEICIAKNSAGSVK